MKCTLLSSFMPSAEWSRSEVDLRYATRGRSRTLERSYSGHIRSVSPTDYDSDHRRYGNLPPRRSPTPPKYRWDGRSACIKCRRHSNYHVVSKAGNLCYCIFGE